MIIDSPIISGSQNSSGPLTQIGDVYITGSLNVLGAINGSITGSITSASYATNAEFLDRLDSTSFVFTSSFNDFSGSAAGRITNLEAFSSSLDATFATDASVTASILVLSQSVQASQAALSSSYTATSGSYVAVSGSYVITSGSYAAASASLSTRVTNTEATASTNTQASASFAAQSASLSTRLTTDETNITTLTNASSSFAAQSASLSTRLTTDETNFTNLSSSFATTSGSVSSRVTLIEGQYATTGSNIFSGTQRITEASNAISFTSTASLYTDGGLRVSKDSYVSGTAYFNNITVYGTSSIEYITSSQVNIGSNVITVNTDTPAVRFGGLSVFDSGSTQLTGSIFWDSEKNHWIYSNPSGSTYNSAMLMNGPRNTGSLGSEQGTTNNALMKGQGGDHITSSQMIDDGTTVQIPGNLQVTGSIVGSNTVTATNGLLIGNGGATATSGYVPKFTGTSTIGNSLVYDNGTNIGIGTTNPTAGRLQINVSDTTTAAHFQIVDGTTTLANSFVTNFRNANDGDGRYSLSRWQVQNAVGNDQIGFIGVQSITGAGAYTPNIVFGQRTGVSTYATRMTLDSSGNLGLGVTPSAWFTSAKVIQVLGAALEGRNTVTQLWCNGYVDAGATGNFYQNTGFASKYTQVNSEHQFFTAPSGTAGNAITFTQAMTLFSTGNLGVGVGGTDAGYKLDVNGTGRFSGTITSTITNALVLSNNTSTTQYVYCSMANSVGNARYGVDNSSGGGLGTGTSANSAVFGNAGNADVDITTNNISRLKIASTGAATFSSSVTAGGDLFLSLSTAAIVFNSAANFNTQIYQTGGSLVLYTGANPRLTIASTGAATFSSSVTATNAILSSRLGVGVSSDQTYASMFVGGDITSGVNQYAIIADPQLSGTSNSYALFANARIKANTAVTNAFGVYIPSAEKMSGATITNNYALYIANQTSGATLNYSIYSSGGLNYFGGNVGIGTNNPVTGLTVNSGAANTSTNYQFKNISVSSGFAGGYTGTAIQSLLAGYDGNSIYGTDIGYGYDGTGYALMFSTNNDTDGNPIERMRITSGGGMSYLGPFISMDGSGAGSFASPPAGLGYGLFPNSGIGLGLSSVVAMSFWTGGTPTKRMTIDSSGNIGAPTGTNIYNASDIRLKKNIVTISNGLDKITALNPVKFNWIDDFVESENGKDILGFIAQEVESIIPEAVEKFSDNTIQVGDLTISDTLRVNEKFIIPVLVKAIQEQQAQIEELKELIAAK